MHQNIEIEKNILFFFGRAATRFTDGSKKALFFKMGLKFC